MNNYKNLFKINEHQIYAEINESSIIVSDLDESTKIIFQEVKNMKMGTFLEWQEYEKNKYISNTEQNKYFKIHELKQQLTPLNEKLLQDAAGEIVPNLDNIKSEFIQIHNEIRILENKQPRQVKNDKTTL